MLSFFTSSFQSNIFVSDLELEHLDALLLGYYQKVLEQMVSLYSAKISLLNTLVQTVSILGAQFGAGQTCVVVGSITRNAEKEKWNKQCCFPVNVILTVTGMTGGPTSL